MLSSSIKMKKLKEYINENNLELDIDNIKSKYKCQLCKSLLIKPKVLKCGCRFCENCIENYLLNTTSPNCPNCFINIEISKSCIVTDYIMENKFDSLLIKCPHMSCDFNSTINELIDYHLENCDKKQIKCFNGCNNNDNLTLGTIKEHFENNFIDHFKLLIDNINKNDLDKQMLNYCDDEMKEMKKKMNDIENKFISKIKSLENSSNSLKTKLRIMSTEVQDLKMENMKLNEKMKKLQNNQQSQLLVSNNETSEIGTEEQENSPENNLGAFPQWKPGQNTITVNPDLIKEYDETMIVFWKLSQMYRNKPFDSHGFYLNSYKFCVQIYYSQSGDLNARLMLKNGKNDAKLKWPLKNKMEYGIMNNDNQYIIKKQLDFEQSKNQSDYYKITKSQKPIHDSFMKKRDFKVIINDCVYFNIKMWKL